MLKMTGPILIINPFGIGDVLFSTPLVSAVKERYPGCYIGYICNIRTRDILETNPEVDEVFVFERDEYRALWKKSKTVALRKLFNFWKEIKKRKFDLLLDLSLGREYALLSCLVGIRVRRGFDYKSRGRFLTHRIPFDSFDDKPVAEYYLDLIQTRSSFSTVLVPTAEEVNYIDNFLKKAGVKEQDVLIGIAPGGGASYGSKKAHYKRWPQQRFAGLTAKIAKYGPRPIILWGPGEEKLVEGIKDKIGPDLLISPETSIRKMAALMKRCKLVICNDGGMLHIAVSQDVPTVSIFGPTDEKVYGPYPVSKKHAVIKSDSGCRPCYKRFKLPDCDTKKCVEDISTEAVFNIVTKNLGGQL